MIIKNFLTTIGGIASVCSLIGIVFGAYLFLNSQMTAIAGDMEQKAVTTFKQEQQLLEKKIEDQQQVIDDRYLEQLRCQKVLIEKEFSRSPSDTLLKDKLEKVNKSINSMEILIEGRIQKRLEVMEKEKEDISIDNSK